MQKNLCTKKRNEKTKEKEEEEGEEAFVKLRFVKSSPKFFMKGDETERWLKHVENKKEEHWDCAATSGGGDNKC